MLKYQETILLRIKIMLISCSFIFRCCLNFPINCPKLLSFELDQIMRTLNVLITFDLIFKAIGINLNYFRFYNSIYQSNE